LRRPALACEAKVRLNGNGRSLGMKGERTARLSLRNLEGYAQAQAGGTRTTARGFVRRVDGRRARIQQGNCGDGKCP